MLMFLSYALASESSAGPGQSRFEGEAATLEQGRLQGQSAEHLQDQACAGSREEVRTGLAEGLRGSRCQTGRRFPNVG